MTTEGLIAETLELLKEGITEIEVVPGMRVPINGDNVIEGYRISFKGETNDYKFDGNIDAIQK